MFSTLGVNYKSAQANWPSDAEYFKRIGVTAIRPTLASFPNSAYTPGSLPGVVGSIEWWRQCAAYFKSQGFIVCYGIARVSVAAGAFTSSVWDTYRLNVLADAAYNQSIGFAPDFYQIGNEIEGLIDGTTLTQSQLISNIKTLAGEVRAIYPLAGRIVYSTYNLNQTNLDLWVAAGLGSLEVLGGNIYGQTTTTGRSFIHGDLDKLGILLRTFGADRFILTEFGITGSATEYAAAPESTRHYNMRQIYAGILELNFRRAFAYSYTGNLEADNDFAFKNINGTFDIQWDVLLNENERLGLTTIGGVTREVSQYRTNVSGRSNSTTQIAVPPPSVPIYFNSLGNIGDYRVIPTARNVLQIGSGDFSIAIYCKPFRKDAPNNNSNHTIARLDFNFGSNLGYLLQLNQNNGSIRWWSGNTAYDSPTALVPFNTDSWIVVTCTGTTVKAYVNGVLAWTQTVVRVGNDAGNNCWYLSEGGRQNGFYGNVYEIMSVRSLLSTTDIANIAAGRYPTMDIRYRFSRGAGRWVNDLSGNNNFGLLAVESWGVAPRAIF